MATAAAMVLAVWLGLASAAWQAERARLESRLVEVTLTAERAQAGLREQLASCRAEVRAPAQVAAAPQEGDSRIGAKALLERQPEGIDACARMESADQAVLRNLKP